MGVRQRQGAPFGGVLGGCVTRDTRVGVSDWSQRTQFGGGCMVRDGPQCTQFRWLYGVAMGAGRGNSCPRRRGGSPFPAPPPPRRVTAPGDPGVQNGPQGGGSVG